MTARCVITGMGSKLGSKVVPVEEIEEKFGKPRGRMRKSFGVENLHYLDDGETLMGMSATAAREAIERAGLRVGDIDGIFGLTAGPTADYLMPGYARVLGYTLGLAGIPMYSVSQGCAGGVHALEFARNRLLADAEMERKRNYLVVSGDDMSRSIDSDDWDTAVLFSSGAAALVMTNCEKPGYVVKKVESMALPSGDRLYCMAVPNSLVSGKIERFRMDGNSVYEFGATEVLPAALELMGWESLPEDCYMIPHQANGKMLKAMADIGGIPRERVYMDGIKYGNTVAASVLMGLKDATDRGLDSPYKSVLLIGFGAELHVAVAHLEKDF